MNSKTLDSNWTTIKEGLCDGLTGNKRSVMEVVLENTRKDLKRFENTMLTESATFGSTSSASVAGLQKVILPVLRRVMPTVIANEIIGVQPMTGPVVQIHTLRVRHADTIPNPTVPGGVIAGMEALGPNYIARFYSGNQDVNNPRGQTTALAEGTPGPRINIQILRETVEAKTRKLSARWTFEAAQDAEAQHGIDIEAEIMAVLAQEIVTEIDQEILNSLRRLAGVGTLYDQSNTSGVATFVGDEHAALGTLILDAANEIAQRTRRGAGNWIVVSPTALTILQSGSQSNFARAVEGTFEAPTNTKFVGVLNQSLRVYVDTYAQRNTPVLIGYKGNETDAAAFYCPYVPLTSSGVIMDPNTLEPVVGFMSRYGYVELTNTANSLGNAADYVKRIEIDPTKIKFY